MMKFKGFFSLILFLFVFRISYSQSELTPGLSNVILQLDTSVFTQHVNTIQYQGENYLNFQYSREDEVCDVKLFPDPQMHIKDIDLIGSGDFETLDSVVNYNNQYYTFKVKFKNLNQSNFLRFRFNFLIDSVNVIREIKLFPTTKTTARLNVTTDEISVGEEKVFELITNNPGNIKISSEWTTNQDIDYRILERNHQLFVHIISGLPGKKTLTLNLKTFKPEKTGNNMVYDMPQITANFNIKTAGLVFLQAEKMDVIADDKAKKDGVEIQLDYNKLLQVNKTYLIESHEQAGSALIATIYIKDRLSNNKVLCLLRIYDYHRKEEGYLYLKENDVPKFITNFNIIPKINIEHIKIMRNGKDWAEDASIFPGETFNLRLEGQSIDKASFHFGELLSLSTDSIIRSENFVEFKLKVPLNISKKTIEIYNYNQNTGKSLTVKEYQHARPLDYVSINYGNSPKRLTDFKGPELYDKTIKDLVISFSPDKIDADNKLYGKQYLTAEIKILGKKGEIVEYTTIDDIVVCPGENSPRYAYYVKTDCKNSDISLNEKISNSTYELKDWSRIKLVIKNTKDKYEQDAQSKSVDIVLQKHYQFDVDVSFPTGLLIKKMNESGIGNFSGVSMAVIAEYSFYDKEKINHLKPYKFGAGFLALNAFNYSSDASRDFGIVFLATINPVNTDRKLSFPVYIGGGYLLSHQTFFWLIGPGISVSF
jgi:hypothetical protein